MWSTSLNVDSSIGHCIALKIPDFICSDKTEWEPIIYTCALIIKTPASTTQFYDYVFYNMPFTNSLHCHLGRIYAENYINSSLSDYHHASYALSRFFVEPINSASYEREYFLFFDHVNIDHKSNMLCKICDCLMRNSFSIKEVLFVKSYSQITIPNEIFFNTCI